MEHLKNILDGMRQVLILDAGSQYIRPSRNGFYKDASMLRGDVKSVASDMNKLVKKQKNGKQAHNSHG